MTALQLFVLFGLPLLIGIAGVLAPPSGFGAARREGTQANPSA